MKISADRKSRKQKHTAMHGVSCSDLHHFNCRTEITIPSEKTEVSHSKYFCLKLYLVIIKISSLRNEQQPESFSAWKKKIHPPHFTHPVPTRQQPDFSTGQPQAAGTSPSSGTASPLSISPFPQRRSHPSRCGCSLRPPATL